MRRFRLPADEARGASGLGGRKSVGFRAPLEYRTAVLAAMGLMAPAALWSEPALAQCTPGIFTGADEICSGTFADITPGGLTNDQVVTIQGVTVTTGGIVIGTDSDLTLIFDPTFDGGNIAHLTESGIMMGSDGGDLTFTALAPAGGIAAHSIAAFRRGVEVSTGGDGTIEVDSALEIVDSLDGYELRTEAGSISATVRAPITTARAGIFAVSETGDIMIDVHHTAPDGQPDILFSNDGTRAIEDTAGILVARRGPRGGEDPTSTITVNVRDDVSIVGPFDAATHGSVDTHSGIMVRPANARIGVILGDNTFIDPVDFGISSTSTTSGVLTRLGTGNTINVNDLNEDGLAIGIHAQSGAVDNTTAYDPINYPHAVAVVTGGGNEINVVGTLADTGKAAAGDLIAGIAAIATPSESRGGPEFAAAEAEGEAVKSSILVSLGTHDGGDGIMAGDQVTVVGDGLPAFPALPSIYGVLAHHRGEGPNTGPAITIRGDDASADTPTHIFVGDDGIEDVTGDGSAGISAQNWGSAGTLIELGAHTYVTVVDNNESVDPDNGDRPVRVGNSVGIHALSGFDEDGGDDVPGGDISIGIGAYNHIDVTGGYGITALYPDASETAKAMVTVGSEALVRSDYSAVQIGGFLFGAEDRPNEAHLYNWGGLVSTGPTTGPDAGAMPPIVHLNARSLIDFTNYADSYVGNAADPAAADPTAPALLADIETAARDGAGSVIVDNYGTMVGTVLFRGNPSGDIDGTLNNMGYWNVVGDTFFDVDGDKFINNGGVIHTVDVAGGESKTVFVQKPSATLAFNNFAWDDGSATFVPGMISMLDGEANDETQIQWNYDGGDFAAGYSGTVAVDAYLDIDGVGEADFLSLRLASVGSNAVYVDNVNPGFGGWNDVGIWRLQQRRKPACRHRCPFRHGLRRPRRHHHRTVAARQAMERIRGREHGDDHRTGRHGVLHRQHLWLVRRGRRHRRDERYRWQDVGLPLGRSRVQRRLHLIQRQGRRSPRLVTALHEAGRITAKKVRLIQSDLLGCRQKWGTLNDARRPVRKTVAKPDLAVRQGAIGQRNRGKESAQMRLCVGFLQSLLRHRAIIVDGNHACPHQSIRNLHNILLIV